MSTYGCEGRNAGIAGIIDNVIRLTGGRLPVIEVPPAGQRRDQVGNFIEVIVSEAKADGFEVFEDGDFRATITFSPAPHTPLKMEDGRPFHLIIWFWRKKGNEVEILDFDTMAKLEDNLRPKAVRVLSDALGVGYRFISQKAKKWLDENQPSGSLPVNVPSVLEIYGVSGYYPSVEREKTGLGRGSQSNMHGHFSVALHPYFLYEEISQVSEAEVGDILKHASPFSWEAFNRFQFFFLYLLQKQFSNLEVSSKNEVTLSEKRASFYQGFEVSIPKGTSITEAFDILLKVQRIGSVIYSVLSDFHKDFWCQFGGKIPKNFSSTKSEGGEDILESGLRKLIIKYSDRLFELLQLENLPEEEKKRARKEFKNLLEYVASIKPTYGQIKTWLKNENLSEEAKGRLEKKRKAYQKIGEKYFGLRYQNSEEETLKAEEKFPNKKSAQEVFRNNELGNQEKLLKERQERLKILIQSFFNVGSKTAEAILRIWHDMLIDPSVDSQWKRVEYVYPGRFSFSFMFEEYGILDQEGKQVEKPQEELRVKKVTVVPVFSSRGVFEVMAGMIIKRPQAQY